MYVKNDNTATRKLHNDDVMPEDYVVEFSENGVANVTQEVGESLIENYDTISKHES
jgi:hypothetical protein